MDRRGRPGDVNTEQSRLFQPMINPMGVEARADKSGLYDKKLLSRFRVESLCETSLRPKSVSQRAATAAN